MRPQRKTQPHPLQNKVFMRGEALPADREPPSVVPERGVTMGGIDVQGHKSMAIMVESSHEEMRDRVIVTGMHTATGERWNVKYLRKEKKEQPTTAPTERPSVLHVDDEERSGYIYVRTPYSQTS